MFEFLKKMRAQKKEEKASRARREKAMQKYREARAEKVLKSKIDAMASMYCPFVDGKCRKSCVHYNNGFIMPGWISITSPGSAITFDVFGPSCKLWVKKKMILEQTKTDY